MWKKVTALLLLFVLPLSQLFCQDLFFGTLDSMLGIIEELERLEQEKQIILNELKDTENERLKEINERESELNSLKIDLTGLRNIVTQQQTSLKNSEKFTVFWRTSTIVLSVTTLAGIITIAVIASK